MRQGTQGEANDRDGKQDSEDAKRLKRRGEIVAAAAVLKVRPARAKLPHLAADDRRATS
jgi:hypothetical protein